MQNKTLQNSLLIAAGIGVGVLGFYLLTKAQAAPLATTGTGVTLTIPTVATISDDGNDVNATLTPGVLNSSEKTAITVGTNNPTGYQVYALLKDLDGVAGQACYDNNNDGQCDLPKKLFYTDNGSGTAGSYMNIQSAAPATGSTLTSLPGAAYLTTPTNLGVLPVTVFRATSANNPDSFENGYGIFTDFTTAEPGTAAAAVEYGLIVAL